MHILYVVGGKGLRYGAEVVAEKLIKTLYKEYNVKYTLIINSKGVISELCEQLGIKYYIVKSRPYVYAKHQNRLINFCKRMLLLLIAIVEDIIAIIQLKRKIDFSKIDIIHTNLSRNMLGARIAKKYHIPHVWYIQEMYNAHYKLNFLMKNQIEFMNNNAKAFIGISETVSRDWINHGLNQELCHTILNGVNEVKERLRKNKKQYSLVMIAEVTPPKGQEFVIEALSHLPIKQRNYIKLDFIGGGNEKYIASLQQKIQKLGLEKIISFLGIIENAAMVVSNYDILINASDGEGFGLSTAEAMMNSVCPLVSDKGANIELVKDKVTGKIFRKTDDFEDFLNSLNYLLNNDIILNLSSKAHNYAIKYLTINRQSKEVFDLYSSIIN